VSEGLAIFYRDITGRKRANARREAQSQLADRLRDVRTPADAAFAASEVLGKTLGAGRVGYATVDLDAGTLRTERDWTAPGVASLVGL
jgi:hypothetical protein